MGELAERGRTVRLESTVTSSLPIDNMYPSPSKLTVASTTRWVGEEGEDEFERLGGPRLAAMSGSNPARTNECLSHLFNSVFSWGK